MKYNTRIAPSPTGDMHLGTARTAYFNWLAARSTGGSFVLRIDDTDTQRSDPKYTQVILDTMQYLGLDHDIICRQSNFFDFYRDLAALLVGKELAKREDGAIVLYPQFIPNSWQDDIAGEIKITDDDKTIINKGLTLIKSDGSPTYHFASVVDDCRFNVNFVIRGSDHIVNTSRQLAIYHALGESHKIPKYAHIGLIHKDGKKLSKRDGAASMLWYKDQGYDPDAMLNFMARLSWGPTNDDKTTALLPRDKMLELFLPGGKMKSSAANLDLVKLDSFDRKYKARKKAKDENNSAHK